MRMSIAAAVLAAASTGMTVGAAAQRFESRAIGVRVDVLVADERRLVTGLVANDFELRDDGVVQEIRQVDVEQLPLNVMLVFDTSQSVAGARMTSLLHAARAVVDGLRERDRVALLSFSTGVRLLSPLTASRLQISSALARLQASGATALRDATFAALSLRETDPGRTLLLVFTDGKDTASWLTAGKVIETARRTDAVVYAVGIRQKTVIERPAIMVRDDYGHPTVEVVGSTRHTVTVDEVGGFVRNLTEETGGRVMFASSDADLRETFTRALDEFRNRYVLSYTPAGVSATGWHRLDVKLKRGIGKVTARRGYFAQ